MTGVGLLPEASSPPMRPEVPLAPHPTPDPRAVGIPPLQFFANGHVDRNAPIGDGDLAGVDRSNGGQNSAFAVFEQQIGNLHPIPPPANMTSMSVASQKIKNFTSIPVTTSAQLYGFGRSNGSSPPKAALFPGQQQQHHHQFYSHQHDRRPSFEFPLAALTKLQKRPPKFAKWSASLAKPGNNNNITNNTAAVNENAAMPNEEDLKGLREELNEMLGVTHKRIGELTDAIKLAERNAKDEKHWERRCSLAAAAAVASANTATSAPTMNGSVNGGTQPLTAKQVLPAQSQSSSIIAETLANSSAQQFQFQSVESQHRDSPAPFNDVDTVDAVELSTKSGNNNNNNKRRKKDGGSSAADRKKSKSGAHKNSISVENSVTPPPIDVIKTENGDASNVAGNSLEIRTVMPDVEGIDYSQAKVTNQTAITSFWSWVDPWLRDLTVEDLSHLKKRIKEHNSQMMVIPPLGRYYLDQWAIEDTLHMPIDDHIPPVRCDPADHRALANYDVTVINGDLMCGALTERILNALMEENGKPILHSTQEEIDAGEALNRADIFADRKREEVLSLEERVRKELTFLGLLDDDNSTDNADNDEICVALRRLQTEYEEVVNTNRKRRQQLYHDVNKRLAFQEYRKIMEEIDKNIEHFYQRRYARPNKKKKKGTNKDGGRGDAANSSSQATDNNNTNSSGGGGGAINGGESQQSHSHYTGSRAASAAAAAVATSSAPTTSANAIIDLSAPKKSLEEAESGHHSGAVAAQAAAQRSAMDHVIVAIRRRREIIDNLQKVFPPTPY